MKTLKDRINEYREAYSYKITRKLPIIINLNGRGFTRVTSGLNKPFCIDFSNAMSATAVKLCHEIDGAVFAFTFNDNITIITRNDQNVETAPWFQNEVQKIVSASASIATLEFNNAARSIGMSLLGEPTFVGNVFSVPNITETINILIAKQQLASQSSLNFATYFELSNKYGDDALDMLQNRTLEDKEELLAECGVSYGSYPAAFRRGIACYRAPMVVPSRDGKTIKNKWIVNSDLPLFTKDHSFLTNIFKSGSDILRAGDF